MQIKKMHKFLGIAILGMVGLFFHNNPGRLIQGTGRHEP